MLVYVEQADGVVDGLSLEALSFARDVATQLGNEVDAVAVGPCAARTAETLGAHGVASVHAVDQPEVTTFGPAAHAAVVGFGISARAPAAVVAAGSDRGNEVLAHVAARHGLPMAANVLQVKVAAGRPWAVARQRWAGSLIEDASLAAPVKLLSVAPHAVQPRPVASGRAAAVIADAVPFQPRDLAVRVVGTEARTGGGVSLTDAKVVVGGGRGVGSAEGFGKLEELAGLLGGAVGGSRVVTSLGWRPHADQIGQTGLRIAPDLYIACGISGAIQHIVGCKAAKRILAINTDAESPIMAVADYAVIGDLGQVVPAISAEIRRRRG
ncbi:MAG TPA: electron transfer flavoprotein subunit alpha/FixB family protein [Candidatus Limnocylindrales bacterium]|nr:electron transfer flavoprotein subunit alpha/FixB family protein [Candidatus Limnocylindrales bacterium]